MPITFESPVPIAQASVIGQVEQYNRDRQFALQQQQLQQHAALARQQLAGQMQMHQADLSLRAGVANAAQRPSDRDAFLADQQAGMQQAGFAQQQAMAQYHQQAQQAEWSHVDEMRLQEYKNAEGEVQKLVASGELNPEQASAYMLQIQTGKNPLDLKRQAAQQKLIDEQTKNMAEQEKARAIGIKTFQDFASAGKPPVIPLPDGSFALVHPDGKFTHVKKEKDAKDTAAADAEKAYQADLKTYFQEYHKAAQWLTKDEMGTKTPPEHSDVEKRLKEMGVEKPVRQPKPQPGIGEPPGPTAQPDVQALQPAIQRASMTGNVEALQSLNAVRAAKLQYGSLNNAPALEKAELQKHLAVVQKFMKDEAERVAGEAVKQANQEEPPAPQKATLRGGVGARAHGNPFRWIYDLATGQ